MMHINPATAAPSPLAPYAAWERSAQGSPAQTLENSGDVVNVRPAPRLLDDAEIQNVLASTVDMISSDAFAALNVHSGLDAGRVAALLS